MKRLSVPHQSADYIFIFLLIIEPFEPILTALIIVHRLSQCERGWGGGVGGGGGGGQVYCCIRKDLIKPNLQFSFFYVFFVSKGNSLDLHLHMTVVYSITKTSLFKYTENFTTKNENFQIKILIFSIFLLET